MKLQVGVKVFLRNPEGKYLLLKRNTEKYPRTNGVWDIVGGRINPGSALLDNLAREVKEETNLTMTSKPVLLHAQDIIPNIEKHVVRLTYTATTKGEPVLDTSENTEYQWVALQDLSSFSDLDVYSRNIVKRNLLPS